MSALVLEAARAPQYHRISVTNQARRLVGVAGCGVITPTTNSTEALLGPRKYRGSADGSYQRMLPLEELNTASCLGLRVSKKLDRFSLLGVAAARAALNEAGFEADDVARCGIVTGNMMAGWTFTEPQLRALHAQGVDSISPYLATAWFPAAPQGQITINLKMRGFAKTLSTDRCAGAQAIGLAYDAIRSGRADFLLAGGVEAPVTPFVECAFAQLGEPTGAMTEAAAYLLLSSEVVAGTVIGFHSTFLIPSSPLVPLAVVEHIKAMADSLPEGWPVRTVICNLPASALMEVELAVVLRQVFKAPELRLIFSTPIIGECLAASGAIAAVMAHEILKQEGSPSSAIVLSSGHQCCDLIWMYYIS